MDATIKCLWGLSHMLRHIALIVLLACCADDFLKWVIRLQNPIAGGLIFISAFVIVISVNMLYVAYYMRFFEDVDQPLLHGEQNNES